MDPESLYELSGFISFNPTHGFKRRMLFDYYFAALNINLPYSDLYAIAVKGIQTQNAECKTSSELGNFWNMMQYLIAQGDVIEGGDFRIKYLTFFKSDKVNGMQFPAAHPVLFLQKSRVFKLYRQSGKNMGDMNVNASKLVLRYLPLPLATVGAALLFIICGKSYGTASVIRILIFGRTPHLHR